MSRLNALARPVLSALLLCLSTLVLADTVDEARQHWNQGELREAGFLLKQRLKDQPDDIEARLLLAAVYLDYDQGAAAEKELRQAQLIGASREQMLALLARALLLQAEYRRLLDEVRVDAVSEPLLQAELTALRGDAKRGLDDSGAARAEYERALALDPRQTDALVGKVRLALADKQIQAARQLLVDATRQDPSAARLWELLGEVDLGRGDTAAAEQSLVKAVIAARSKWMPRFKRALMRLEAGKLDAATADIDAVAKEFPDFPGLLFARGSLLVLRGDLADGLALLDAYRKYDPTNARALCLSAVGEMQRGNLALAQELARACLAQRPQSVQANRLLAQVLLAQEDPIAAEALLRDALAARPDRPELLAVLAQALDQQGRLTDSKQALLRTVELAPDEAAYRVAAADGLYRTGDHEAALAQLAEALSLDPLHRTAPLMQIKILLEQQRSESALELATGLASARGNDPYVLNALGLAKLANQDAEGARATFAAALDADPSFPDAALNLAKLSLGDGDTQRSRALLEQVIDAVPGHVEAILALAELDGAAGDVRGQQRRLRQAMDAFPREARFRLALARSHLRHGSPEQARILIQSAAEQMRNQPEMLLLQAQAQQALGDLDAAVETFDALQLQSPDSGTPNLLLAGLHAKRGDSSAMEQALIAGAKIDPASALLPSALNNGLAMYKDPARKLALLDRLIEATNADPRLTVAKADLLVEQRQYGPAAELMWEMRGLYPRNAGVMRKLVGVLRAGQADERAQQVLQAWIARNPGDLVAAVMLAQIQAELGNADEARELLEGLAASEPALRSNPLILNNLAWLLRDSDPAQARAYAERALLGDPSSAAIMDTLGSLLVESGDLDRALTLLEAAHRAEPRDATIGFHYAFALANAGRKVEARVLLLDLVDKRFPEQQAAQALLAELDG